MKYYVVVLGVLLSLSLKAQNPLPEDERFPIFSDCENATYAEQENCFNNQVRTRVINNLTVPSVVTENNYKGKMTILFETTPEGNFRLIYVDAYYNELKTVVEKAFEGLPKVRPATYNGNPIFMQFRMPIYIPLARNEKLQGSNKIIEKDAFSQTSTNSLRNQTSRPQKTSKENPLKNEYDSITKAQIKYTHKQYTSELNIPFSHEVYSRFDDEMNMVGTNAHTASKPLLYSEVNPYYDFREKNKAVEYDVDSWLGRKFFNEHLVRLQGKDYWLVADIAADLQIGKDFDADFNNTYNNTRAAVIQGGE